MPSSRNFLCLVFPLISFPLPSAATSRKSSFLPSFTSSRSTGFEWRAVRPAANARPISRGLRRSATCRPNRSGRPPVGWIQRFGEFDSTTRHLVAGLAAGGRRKRSKLTRDVARHSNRNQVHELLGVAAGVVMMSLVRLIGFRTLGCGCVTGHYREVATNREVTYVEEKGTGCEQTAHRRNHTLAAARAGFGPLTARAS